MQFGQLIEYNMRHIFFEKSYLECDGKTSPTFFSEKLKLCISLEAVHVFFLYAKLSTIEIY